MRTFIFISGTKTDRKVYGHLYFISQRLFLRPTSCSDGLILGPRGWGSTHWNPFPRSQKSLRITHIIIIDVVTTLLWYSIRYILRIKSWTVSIREFIIITFYHYYFISIIHYMDFCESIIHCLERWTVWITNYIFSRFRKVSWKSKICTFFYHILSLSK